MNVLGSESFRSLLCNELLVVDKTFYVLKVQCESRNKNKKHVLLFDIAF